MNFDRVADIYDATRGLPEHVLETVAAAIVRATNAGPETRFLELGIGTGRIALPLLKYGFPYTGVDISAEMMQRLMTKAPSDAGNLTLVEGDVSDLPFGDDAFDVVLSVHLLHLVPEWRTVLREIQRVLAPGGCYVHGGNDHGASSPGGEIRHRWRDIATELGAPLRPSYGSREAVETALIDSGARLAVYRAVRWEGEVRPLELIDAIRRRTYSQSWEVPEEIMEATHERMLQWVGEHFEDPSQPAPTSEEFGFMVARWPNEE
jgi:ubiquinone/menaquinone biosynthesis C-methylase UbiE